MPLASTAPRRLALLLAFLVATASASAAPPDEWKKLERRFDVRPGETLHVEADDADLVVETGGDDEAYVEVYLTGRDRDRAEAYYERLDVRVERSGEGVVVVIREPGDNGWRFRRDGGAGLRIRAVVPERFDLDLASSDGDIRLDGFTGRASIHTSDGDIVARRLTGPTLSIRTSDGDLRFGVLDGDDVSLRTSDGDIEIGKARGRTLRIATSDGDVQAEVLDGEVELSTSDGTIILGAVTGPRASLRTSDGGVRVSALRTGGAEIRSGDGDVELDGVEGDLNASAGGDIRVRLLGPGDVSLSSSDGDIIVEAPRDLAADLRFRGEDVNLSRAFDFNGSVARERAEGRLNAGGPRLEATAGDGSVTLRER